MNQMLLWNSFIDLHFDKVMVTDCIAAMTQIKYFTANKNLDSNVQERKLYWLSLFTFLIKKKKTEVAANPSRKNFVFFLCSHLVCNGANKLFRLRIGQNFWTGFLNIGHANLCWRREAVTIKLGNLVSFSRQNRNQIQDG